MAPDCVFCNKECKNSDSRPFPSSKSKDRIHNKCQIKKSLADKSQTLKSGSNDVTKSSLNMTPTSVLERLEREEVELRRASEEKKLSRILENKEKEGKQKSDTTAQFFFDVKAGIAKPHEKRRYLNHRNLTEIVARFDDNGFQDEVVGRTYDCGGRDLNTLGDDSDTGEGDKEGQVAEKDLKVAKRKHDHPDTMNDGPKKGIKLDNKNPCWFCLSSANVEKHLIIAIGEYCYLTLAKGGLTDDHLLLIPIEHVQSLNSDDNSSELLQELERFKKSLVKFYAKSSKGVVFFERNFRSVHWQLQVVPLPLDIIHDTPESIKSLSKTYFANSDYVDVPTDCRLSDVIPPGAPYFYWQLEPVGARFVTEIQVKGSFFPLQLGRMVLADSKILNCQDRVDWKSCVKSTEDYVRLAGRTKELYQEFDITD